MMCSKLLKHDQKPGRLSAAIERRMTGWATRSADMSLPT
jgi:hypothetical protein